MDWHLLPPAEDRVVAEVCRAARGRFTGDPSHQYTEPHLMHREGVEAMENEVPVKAPILFFILPHSFQIRRIGFV